MGFPAAALQQKESGIEADPALFLLQLCWVLVLLELFWAVSVFQGVIPG